MDLSLVTWRKSSHSIGNGGECVEISAEPTLRPARDSKNPDGSVLAFGSAEWRAFTETIKSGRARHCEGHALVISNARLSLAAAGQGV
jgi:hypothetical protein